MIKEIADFIMAHDMGIYMFDYLFVFKYNRVPTKEERESFDEIWNGYNDEQGSYQDDNDYDESLSYGD